MTRHTEAEEKTKRVREEAQKSLEAALEEARETHDAAVKALQKEHTVSLNEIAAKHTEEVFLLERQIHDIKAKTEANAMGNGAMEAMLIDAQAKVADLEAQCEAQALTITDLETRLAPSVDSS